jgi:hypothetical protein
MPARLGRGDDMSGKAVISLTTGLEDDDDHCG